MKSIFKYSCIVAAVAFFAAGCSSYQSKSPIPAFAAGTSLVAVPTPWTSRPFLSLSAAGSSVTYNFSSYNLDELAKVDVFVTYLDNNPIIGVTGPAACPLCATPIPVPPTVANWIAPISPADMLIQPGKYLPQSGSAPIAPSFVNYDKLIKLAATPAPKVLLVTFTGADIKGDKTFTLAQLMSATGKTTFSPAPTNPTAANSTFDTQPAFMLVFEVTRKDGGLFSYVNSGPGITLNPATGKVVLHNWTDPGGVVRKYQVIETGTEGSPFIPGVVIRVAP